jgi:DNA-binding response OmpR family regulator
MSNGEDAGRKGPKGPAVPKGPKIDKTILLIDDDENLLRITKYFLETEGFTVKAASNPRVGIKIAGQGGIDLIICDIMMPEMDGYTVCKTLNENDETFSIPMVFLSAKSEPSDRLLGFFSGAIDYMTKPFKKEDLLRKARKLLKIESGR